MKSHVKFTRLSGMVLVCAVFTMACSSTRNRAAEGKQAIATIAATTKDTPGNGMITFTQQDGNIVMNISVSFPAKAGQSVAVHLHEHGDCGNAGNDAHGHWNPTNSQHGKWGSAQYHLGDIGNISLDQEGKGSMRLITDKWSIGTGKADDVLGRAIIVHNGVDDYVTQPTGNAGSRIGCGVIRLN